jgi:hypothetical protein
MAKQTPQQKAAAKKREANLKESVRLLRESSAPVVSTLKWAMSKKVNPAAIVLAPTRVNSGTLEENGISPKTGKPIKKPRAGKGPKQKRDKFGRFAR